MSHLLPLHLSAHRLPLLYFAAGATSAALCSFLYSSLTSTLRQRVIPSPLRTCHPVDLENIAYPAHGCIPGARDIYTPHGSIRAYEFGLEDGRKVLLVHGISAPTLPLAMIGEKLAEKGCRVLMSDLFGRGFSDGVGDVEHDNRLYISQMLYVLLSSPLSWLAGTEAKQPGFSIIGWSMGGGIAAAFTSYFPHLVEDLVLLTQAGLGREESTPWPVRLLRSSFVPYALKSYIARDRNKTASSTLGKASKQNEPMPTDPYRGDAEKSSTAASGPVAFGRIVDSLPANQWQLEHHEGFISSYISSIRFGPLCGQHHLWRQIGRRLEAQRNVRGSKTTSPVDDEITRAGLKLGKVLVVLGKDDRAIPGHEFIPDAFATTGEENLEVLQLDAGHAAPRTHAHEIVEWIWGHWSYCGEV